MCQLPAKTLLQGDELFMEFKGALTENLVAQILTTKYDEPLYYWGKANQAEVDFLIHIDADIIPLEIKAGSSKNKKSLQLYKEKYDPAILAHTSIMNLKHDGDLHNYPLYLLSSFVEIY